MTGGDVPTDLVRNAATELLARDIHERNISGAVAEVGVYQGNFAALFNYHFPDRTLYLFDTFEGFDGHDTSVDLYQPTLAALRWFLPEAQ